MDEADGWNYTGTPEAGRDARKLVTLTEGGMVWVGIRAWHHHGGYWMNNGEPERDTVKAWRDLPSPAAGFWDRGNLYVPKTPNVEGQGDAQGSLRGSPAPQGSAADVAKRG